MSSSTSNTQSIWRAAQPLGGFPSLQGEIQTGVLIIGGGITGLTLALLLAERGQRVVLLEAGDIGSGTSGHSTGNLYATLSQGLHTIVSAWGADQARQVVAARQDAMDFIEAQCRNAPEAQFRRCPLALWAREPSGQAQVEQEFQALQQAGCTALRRRELPAGLPAPVGDVLWLPEQAQLQPQNYLSHLAGRAAAVGAVIHEQSCVLEIDFQNRRATTASGSVVASDLVMATHTPKGIRMVHAQMPVHREYGLALPLADAGPGPGIFWWQGEEGLSIRTLEQDGRHWLVCVGQEHPTGHHNSDASLRAVEQIAHKHLGLQGPAFRWSAQNYRSADGLPYIGRDSTGCWLATGFATDGLTWGTVAALEISRQMGGQASELGRRCDPTRLSLIKGAKTIAEETLTTARALVTDYVTQRHREALDQLAAGDSAIVEIGGKACAAWRSPRGELFAVSAACTHMGCQVHWNAVETSWDCPCHGSRFRPDGSVIEGPALAPLTRQHIQEPAPQQAGH